MQKIALSDENLFQMCRKFGGQAKFWRQRFLGLLPEVQRRRLYERKGFSSIFEFAKKLAGVSEEQVRLVLNLERKFERTPVLQAMLVRGEVSANKLVRVASIATVENQEAWAEQVKILSKSALETLVRDERRIAGGRASLGGVAGVDGASGGETVAMVDGLLKPTFENISLPGQSFNSINRDLELLQKLPAELKERLHQIADKGIDIGVLLTELLDRREREIEERKVELAELEEKKAGLIAEKTHDGEKRKKKRVSRYISVAIRKVLKEEFGSKCAISGCGKDARQIHHSQRFALSPSHDPRLLVPLCEDHHEIAHSIDARYRLRRQEAVA